MGVGWVWVQVQFKEHSRELDLVIKKSPYNSFLGMDWFRPLKIEGKGINQTVTTPGDYINVCNEFLAIFDISLGLYNGPWHHPLLFFYPLGKSGGKEQISDFQMYIFLHFSAKISFKY